MTDYEAFDYDETVDWEGMYRATCSLTCTTISYNESSGSFDGEVAYYGEIGTDQAMIVSLKLGELDTLVLGMLGVRRDEIAFGDVVLDTNRGVYRYEVKEFNDKDELVVAVYEVHVVVEEEGGMISSDDWVTQFKYV